MIMMVYYYLPFMVFPLYSSLEKMDVKTHRSVDGSRSDVDPDANPGNTSPDHSRLKGRFFLVYIPSFGEFAIPELMGGDRQMFVGTVISNYILGEKRDL